MEELGKPRAQARERRDKIIASAREKYRVMLARIAELERDLCGDEIERRSNASYIDQSIPNDKPFTAGDLLFVLGRLGGMTSA